MKILAIRFARLGDIILLLPALSAIKASFPNAHLAFLTGQPCAPIGRMCPSVDEVIAVDRAGMRDGPVLMALAEIKRLMSDIRRRQFDIAIDFHSFRETNLLTGFSGAKRRLGMKRYDAAYLSFCFNMPPVPEDKSIHVRDMFLRIVERIGSGSPASRNLSIPPAAATWARTALPHGRRVSIYVDSSGNDKTWPASRFAQVADFARQRLMARVAVLSGRGSVAAENVKRLATESSDVTVFPDLPLEKLAALIASSDLLISNDTGPMHFGPALGVPTLGIFSVGLPEHFRPTGPMDRYLRANPISDISVDTVTEAAEEMWAKTAGPDPRR